MPVDYQAIAKTMKLPLPPWTHEKLGEELYCKLAQELGFFDPRTERANYRPSLDPTSFLDEIRRQYAAKSTKE